MDDNELEECRRLIHAVAWREIQKARAREKYEIAQCNGKHRFDSFNQAASTLVGRELRHKAEPYRCGVCHAWHIGGIFRQKRLTFLRRRGR